MRTRIILAAIIVAALLVPAFAAGDEGAKDNGLSWCDENYLDLYDQAADLGYPLGKNVVKAGYDDSRSCPQMRKLEGIVQELTAPPPAPEPTASESTTTAPTPTTSTGSASAIPSYITQCESGGDYSAVNPSSGAYGAYQIMPSTASAYGCDLSTPAGQDACAAEIYGDVGASAWSCG